MKIKIQLKEIYRFRAKENIEDNFNIKLKKNNKIITRSVTNNINNIKNKMTMLKIIIDYILFKFNFFIKILKKFMIL